MKKFTLLIFIIFCYKQACPDSATENCLKCEGSACDVCANTFPESTGCANVETALSNCISYNADKTCKYCERGYSLVSGACKKNTVEMCDIGYHNDEAKCWSCKNGYYPSADNSKCEKETTACSEMVSNCSRCAKGGD